VDRGEEGEVKEKMERGAGGAGRGKREEGRGKREEGRGKEVH
jgi:hypothetical protein